MCFISIASVILLFLLNNFISSSYGNKNVSNISSHQSTKPNVVKASIGSVWDVVIKTCDEQGAGTDAAVYLKVFYETDHASEIFQLDNPGTNDFERGQRNHFKVFLKYKDIINIGLFWWPGFTLNEDWCVDWVLLLNSDQDKCYEGIFNRWILHYKDPPTYAVKFHRLAFADCVNPAPKDVKRFRFMRLLDDKVA